MQAIKFDGEGFKAEAICASQFNGKLTNVKQDQYKDIDLFITAKDGTIKSCSVKDQLRGTSKGWTSVQLELTTINTRTGAKRNGCFYTNESDYYFWRIWTAEYGDTWAVIESVKLKEWVEDNKGTLRKWSTKPATEAKNRSYNRVYDRSEGVELEVSVMRELGKLIKVKETIQ